MHLETAKATCTAVDKGWGHPFHVISPPYQLPKVVSRIIVPRFTELGILVN
jgi:hypothetical protein